VAIRKGGDALKQEIAVRLAEALARTLETVGLSATEFAGAMLGIPIPEKEQKLVQMGYKAFLTQKFREMPEPSKAQLDQLLTMINAFGSAPQNLRSWMKHKVKELPHSPGGPPRKVKLAEELAVCAEIQANIVEYGTREAIRQVARRRKASERTIYRIWGKYHPKKKKARPASQ
jgi:hypothetical protein